jgi:hypothetical protein
MVELVLLFTATTLFTTNALLTLFLVEKWNKMKEEQEAKNKFSVVSPDDIIRHYEETY